MKYIIGHIWLDWSFLKKALSKRTMNTLLIYLALLCEINTTRNSSAPPVSSTIVL